MILGNSKKKTSNSSNLKNTKAYLMQTESDHSLQLEQGQVSTLKLSLLIQILQTNPLRNWEIQLWKRR